MYVLQDHEHVPSLCGHALVARCTTSRPLPHAKHECPARAGEHDIVSNSFRDQTQRTDTDAIRATYTSLGARRD